MTGPPTAILEANVRLAHLRGCRSAPVDVKAPALAMLGRVGAGPGADAPSPAATQPARGSLAEATSPALPRGRGLTSPGLRWARCSGGPDERVSASQRQEGDPQPDSARGGRHLSTHASAGRKTKCHRLALTTGPSHESGSARRPS
jgi:hypothetical protein